MATSHRPHVVCQKHWRQASARSHVSASHHSPRRCSIGGHGHCSHDWDNLLARASVGVRAGVGQATVQGRALSHWSPQALQSPQGRRPERARVGQAPAPAQALAPACTGTESLLTCWPATMAGMPKGMNAMGTAVASSPCRSTSLQRQRRCRHQLAVQRIIIEIFVDLKII